MTTLTLKAAALAALVALPLAAAPAPALAGGQFTISAAPGSAEADLALRAGLAIFGIARDIDANGKITQRGRDNAAGLLQNGRGNFGIVHQDGRGHTGTLEQYGDGNSHGLFQFGRNTRAAVRQDGGQSGLTFQFGF